MVEAILGVGTASVVAAPAFATSSKTISVGVQTVLGTCVVVGLMSLPSTILQKVGAIANIGRFIVPAIIPKSHHV